MKIYSALASACLACLATSAFGRGLTTRPMPMPRAPTNQANQAAIIGVPPVKPEIPVVPPMKPVVDIVKIIEKKKEIACKIAGPYCPEPEPEPQPGTVIVVPSCSVPEVEPPLIKIVDEEFLVMPDFPKCEDPNVAVVIVCEEEKVEDWALWGKWMSCKAPPTTPKCTVQYTPYCGECEGETKEFVIIIAEEPKYEEIHPEVEIIVVPAEKKEFKKKVRFAHPGDEGEPPACGGVIQQLNQNAGGDGVNQANQGAIGCGGGVIQQLNQNAGDDGVNQANQGAIGGGGGVIQQLNQNAGDDDGVNQANQGAIGGGAGIIQQLNQNAGDDDGVNQANQGAIGGGGGVIQQLNQNAGDDGVNQANQGAILGGGKGVSVSQGGAGQQIG